VKSLSTKLIILLIMAVLIPLSFYGILSIWTSRHFNFKSVTEGNINVAKRASGEIDLYISNSMAILNALAQNLGRFNIAREEQRLILGNYILNFPEFREIHIADNKGKLIISSNNISEGDVYFDKAFDIAMMDKIYKSDVYISKNLTPSMTIALPLKRLNTIVGVAIANIDLLKMWNLVDSIRIGKGSYAFVVSGDGRLIAHGLGDGKARVLSNENMKPLKIVRDVLDGKYTVDTYKNIEGKEVIGVAAPIPSMGWGIVIEENLIEAYAPTRRMTFQLTILVILFVTAVSILGYTGGRRFFIQPIGILINTTRKISKGNLDEEVTIRTGDEFEEVGDAFNRMMHQLKIFQEEIKRNERIAFMNKIAAGLVHDLRHPIRSIENSSRLIMKDYDKEDYRNTFKNVVTRELRNINQFLEDLLNLSHPLHLTPISLDICVEMDNITETFRDEAEKKGVKIETTYSDKDIRITGDKFSLERLFKNIIRNAIEAMPGGGTLSIYITSISQAVEIRFKDTGHGVPADKINGLFTEFTTTKGDGIGLGLAISKRIIDAHNGTISIESEIGKGTTVRIILPLSGN